MDYVQKFLVQPDRKLNLVFADSSHKLEYIVIVMQCFSLSNSLTKCI